VIRNLTDTQARQEPQEPANEQTRDEPQEIIQVTEEIVPLAQPAITERPTQNRAEPAMAARTEESTAIDSYSDYSTDYIQQLYEIPPITDEPYPVIEGNDERSFPRVESLTLIQDAQITENQTPFYGVPLISFANRNVPLYAPVEAESWALLNLIFSILGLAIATVYTVRSLLFNNGKKHRKGYLIAAITLAILVVVIFLLTQNMTSQMVLMDRWTPIQSTIILAETVAIMLIIGKASNVSKSEMKEEQQTAY